MPNTLICTEQTTDPTSLKLLFKNNGFRPEKAEKLAGQVLSAYTDADINPTPAMIIIDVNTYLVEVHSSRNNLEKVKNLLEAGAHPHGTFGYEFHLNGGHPIHNAILNGNLEMLETIIDHTLEHPLEEECCNAIQEILQGSLDGENNEWGKQRDQRDSHNIVSRIIVDDKLETQKPERPLPVSTYDHKDELIEIIKSGNEADLNVFLSSKILLKDKDYGNKAEGVRKLIRENWNKNDPNKGQQINEALTILESRPRFYRSLSHAPMTATSFFHGNTNNANDADACKSENKEYVLDTEAGSQI